MANDDWKTIAREARTAWITMLHTRYGPDVVEAKLECLHCLTRGKMLFQFHMVSHEHARIAHEIGLGFHANTVIDHYSLWRIGPEPLVFVTQPYHVTHDDLRGMLAYCDAHGLELELDQWAAFHYPSGVVGIAIWNRAVRAKYMLKGGNA